MFVRLLTGILLAGFCALSMAPVPAAAQWENIDTVEGPGGEETTLIRRPHSLADGVSVRALGITRSDSTRWALGLVGAAPEDTIALRYGEESLSIQEVRRPSDGVGPTRVFVSADVFLTLAETATATLQVGDVRATLPAQLRREMKEIFERVR